MEEIEKSLWDNSESLKGFKGLIPTLLEHPQPIDMKPFDLDKFIEAITEYQQKVYFPQMKKDYERMHAYWLKNIEPHWDEIKEHLNLK